MYAGHTLGRALSGLSGVGFVQRIITPGTPQTDVWMIGLNPLAVSMARYGEATAVYSDNTVRNEAGAVVASAGLVTNAPNNVFNPLAVPASGIPWPVKSTDPRLPGTTGGIAPGEQPRTEPTFVPGVLPYEPVHDDSQYGGWGAPILLNSGHPSSYQRRDDRWIWPDGRITDAQQTVLGFTATPDVAVRELTARGATPSITWKGSQVIYTPASPNAVSATPLTDVVGQPPPNMMQEQPLNTVGTSPTYDGPLVGFNSDGTPILGPGSSFFNPPAPTPLTDAVGENPLTPPVAVVQGGPPVVAGESGGSGLAILAGVGVLAFLAGRGGR